MTPVYSNESKKPNEPRARNQVEVSLGIFGIINKPSIRKCLKRIPKNSIIPLNYFLESALVYALIPNLIYHTLQVRHQALLLRPPHI